MDIGDDSEGTKRRKVASDAEIIRAKKASKKLRQDKLITTLEKRRAKEEEEKKKEIEKKQVVPLTELRGLLYLNKRSDCC